MEHNQIQIITRTALLLASTLILQSLRLILPLPPQTSMFLIGSLVNLCFVLAVLRIGWKSGLLIALITPLFAYLEGMLPFLPFIFPVALGNGMYIAACWLLKRWKIPGICASAFIKAAAMYTSFYLLFSFVAFPEMVRHMILLVMSWPQIITAVLGGISAYIISKRI